MGTAQENFDKGVQLRLEGNEAFKKQDLKQGNLRAAAQRWYNTDRDDQL